MAKEHCRGGGGYGQGPGVYLRPGGTRENHNPHSRTEATLQRSSMIIQPVGPVGPRQPHQDRNPGSQTPSWEVRGKQNTVHTVCISVWLSLKSGLSKKER